MLGVPVRSVSRLRKFSAFLSSLILLGGKILSAVSLDRNGMHFQIYLSQSFHQFFFVIAINIVLLQKPFGDIVEKHGSSHLFSATIRASNNHPQIIDDKFLLMRAEYFNVIISYDLCEFVATCVIDAYPKL